MFISIIVFFLSGWCVSFKYALYSFLEATKPHPWGEYPREGRASFQTKVPPNHSVTCGRSVKGLQEGRQTPSSLFYVSFHPSQGEANSYVIECVRVTHASHCAHTAVLLTLILYI